MNERDADFKPSNCLILMTIAIESFGLFPFLSPASRVFTAATAAAFPKYKLWHEVDRRLP